MSSERFQVHWKNPRVRFVSEVLWLFQYWNNNVEGTTEEKIGFFQQVWNILSSDVCRKVLEYLLTNGAASALVLKHHTGLSSSSIYWALDRLSSLGLLRKGVRIRAPNKKRVTIHILADCDMTLVQDAALLHVRTLSPKYRVAERAAQLILEEYLSPRQVKEITYKEIVLRVKSLKLPFSTPDIADLAAQYLHEQGVRVWR